MPWLDYSVARAVEQQSPWMLPRVRQKPGRCLVFEALPLSNWQVALLVRDSRYYAKYRREAASHSDVLNFTEHLHELYALLEDMIPDEDGNFLEGWDPPSYPPPGYPVDARGNVRKEKRRVLVLAREVPRDSRWPRATNWPRHKSIEQQVLDAAMSTMLDGRV